MTEDREATGTAAGREDYGSVTAAMVQSLVETRPWVLFISILGFIMAGLMVLLAFFVFVVAGFAQSFASEFGVGGFVIGDVVECPEAVTHTAAGDDHDALV